MSTKYHLLEECLTKEMVTQRLVKVTYKPSSSAGSDLCAFAFRVHESRALLVDILVTFASPSYAMIVSVPG